VIREVMLRVIEVMLRVIEILKNDVVEVNGKSVGSGTY